MVAAQRATDEVAVDAVTGEIAAGSPSFFEYVLSEVPVGEYYILGVIGISGESFEVIGAGYFVGYYGMPNGGDLSQKSVVTVEGADLTDYDVEIWMDAAEL